MCVDEGGLVSRASKASGEGFGEGDKGRGGLGSAGLGGSAGGMSLD